MTRRVLAPLALAAALAIPAAPAVTACSPQQVWIATHCPHQPDPAQLRKGCPN